MVHMELCLPSIEALCIILINMYLEAERVPSLLTLLMCHLDINIFTIIWRVRFNAVQNFF